MGIRIGDIDIKKPIVQSGVDINDYYNLTKKTSGTVYGYIKQIPLIDTSDYTSMSSMFKDYVSLTTIPQLDTSKVTNMYGMFEKCSSLTTISQLDTSNVTNMYGMFRECSSLITIPLLDTSKVTEMRAMFFKCLSLTTIPQLDTSNVTSMEQVFNVCLSLITIPLLDASKVTSVYYMIYSCTELTTLGGFTNLGQAYDTTKSANYNHYALDLSGSTKLTHDSLMNVINNLYDIATKGCQPQKLQLGVTNISKLTEEEISIATNKGWVVS